MASSVGEGFWYTLSGGVTGLAECVIGWLSEVTGLRECSVST